MGHKKKKKDRIAKIEKNLKTAGKELIKTEPQRDDKGRFLPGNTESKGLNRKYQKHVVEYIMGKTDNLTKVLDKAYKMLVDKKTSDADKIKLIEILLNRAIGKPVQMTHIDSDQGMPTLIFNFNNTETKVEEEWEDPKEPDDGEGSRSN